MIFIDCSNISLNKIIKLENLIISNNFKNKIIINYQKNYKSKTIKVKKINNKKKYVKLLKKATVVFLSNTKSMNEVTEYNEKAFIISDFCKGNYQNYYNVTLNEIPKVIKEFEAKKEKIKKKKKNKIKRKNRGILKKIFKFILNLLIILILFSLILFLIFLCYKKINKDDNKNKKIIKENINKKNNKLIKENLKKDYRNENYAFVGDSITNFYDTERFFEGIPSVNTGVCGYTTDDIYNNLNKFVYIYNPTKIFLLIGTNDLPLKDDEYIINRISDIIVEINKNRPNAKLYLESIYPVNNTDNEKINHGMVNKRDNNRIKHINSEIKKICDSGNCEYINMYDLLKDEDDNLKLEYTDEGLHISEEGYKVITNKLKEVSEKE